MDYQFTLTLKLAPDDSNVDELVERLGAAGCTDAMVGAGQAGQLALEFIRGARSAEQAIISALKDARKAIPSAKLIEVGPDLVGLSDVADLLGVTRQNVRKLMLTHTAAFPVPVHAGTVSLWHLAPVLEFLRGRGYAFAPDLADVARAAMRINIASEAARIGHAVDRRLAALAG